MTSEIDLLDTTPETRVGQPKGLPKDVDSITLAALLGLSQGRVTALAKSGDLPRVGWRFPIPEAVQTYVEYTRKNPSGRRIADPGLHDQKLRMAKEQADKLALANQVTRDELVPVESVRLEWRSIAMDLRARLLAIGPRVSANLGLDRKAAASLDSELRAALEDISDGN